MKFSALNKGFYTEAMHGGRIPSDAVEISDEDYAELLAGQAGGQCIDADADGYPILVNPPPPTPQALQEALVARVQQHLDAAARALGYDNIFTAVTYADEPAVPRFQTEGQGLRAWRSLIWAAAAAILADVQAGHRTVPSAEALINELPPIPTFN